MYERLHCKKESSFLAYTEKNSLYGRIMMESLQIVNINRLRIHQCLQKPVSRAVKNCEIGYFLILDLEYPSLYKHSQFLQENIKTTTTTTKHK